MKTDFWPQRYLTGHYVVSSQHRLVWPCQRAVCDCCELQKAAQYVTGEAQDCIMILGCLCRGLYPLLKAGDCDILISQHVYLLVFT